MAGSGVAARASIFEALDDIAETVDGFAATLDRIITGLDALDARLDRYNEQLESLRDAVDILERRIDDVERNDDTLAEDVARHLETGILGDARELIDTLDRRERQEMLLDARSGMGKVAFVRMK